MVSRATEHDVVVVGAGAAGLGAARALRDAGRSVLVLEARRRAGGRAYTELESFGAPLDLGCAFLHGGDENPFTRMAEERGLELAREPLAIQLRFEDRWATERERADRFALLDRIHDVIDETGRAGLDVPASEVAALPASPWRRAIERVMAALWGVEIAQLSTRDALAYGPSGEDFRVRSGYGALIASLAEGVRVELGAAVTRIASEPEGVRVTTSRGELRAAHAIVALPVGVLAAGHVRFEPALPSEVAEALAAIQPGAAAKVVLPCEAPLAGVSDGTWAIPQHATASLQIRPFGHPFAIAYVAGEVARELEAAGPRAMLDVALSAMRDTFGAAAARVPERWVATAWTRDPLALGAYSTTRPGHAGARAVLRRPLRERIHFAGEHVAERAFGTAHGAFWSGERAARAVLAAAR